MKVSAKSYRLKMQWVIVAFTTLFLSDLYAASPKFAHIDMQAIILNVEDGKAARGKLEKEIKAKEKQLLKKKKELDKMNEEWKNQMALLSEQARIAKQKEFQEKFMALRNEEMKFQAEIKQKENGETRKIAEKVEKIVQVLAKKQGFDAVFERNSSGLVYLKEAKDLTKSVIDNYNKK